MNIKPLPLPSKGKPKFEFRTASFEANSSTPIEDLPFTVEEVAIALGVNVEGVRHIIKRRNGSYEIRFKPDYHKNNTLKIGDIANFLETQNVDNLYLGTQLIIEVEGLQDFINYVSQKI